MKQIEPTPAAKLAALAEHEARRADEDRQRQQREREEARLLSLGYLPNRHGRRAYRARNRKLLAAHPERNMAAAPESTATQLEDDNGR